MNTAIRILTGRDHSKHELAQKLKKRKYENEIIDQVISACERFDYLNDERTAQLYVGQLKRKGYGKKRIRFDLNRKGLKGKRIQAILSRSVSEKEERECALRVFQKQLKRFESEEDSLKRKNKIYRYLYSRGFSETVISELVKKSDKTVG
ncbi:MAG: recombination regulator RecX [Deltaproteobacteria bacterium]|nr:recombination regulator RecX [Deltaproteobacteria bacterium]